MQEFWNKIYENYGNSNDLEEKQRLLLSNFLKGKKGKLIELACGNGKVISDILVENKDLDILGIDYNISMINEAKKRIDGVNFIEGNILEIEQIVGKQKFDYVVCLNSIHNLPNIYLINIFFENMKSLVKDGGYIIFDIRNKFNPFINYGYLKNRKKGLDFFTLNKSKTLNKFGSEFEIFLDLGITYNNLKDAGKDKSNLLFKLIYFIYLKITKINFFAPYQFIIIRKK